MSFCISHCHEIMTVKEKLPSYLYSYCKETTCLITHVPCVLETFTIEGVSQEAINVCNL